MPSVKILILIAICLFAFKSQASGDSGKKYSLYECTSTIGISLAETSKTVENPDYLSEIQEKLKVATVYEGIPLAVSSFSRGGDKVFLFFSDECENREKFTSDIIVGFLRDIAYLKFTVLSTSTDLDFDGFTPLGPWK